MIVRPPSRRTYRGTPTATGFVGGFDGWVEELWKGEREELESQMAELGRSLDLDADDVEVAGTLPGHGLWDAWACVARVEESGEHRCRLRVLDAVPHAASVGELAAIVSWAAGPSLDARACARAVWSRWGRRYAERMGPAWSAMDADATSLVDELGREACAMLVSHILPAGFDRRVRALLPTLSRSGADGERVVLAIVVSARQVASEWGCRTQVAGSFGESLSDPDPMGLLARDPYAYVGTWLARMPVREALGLCASFDEAVLADLSVDGRERSGALVRIAAEAAASRSCGTVFPADDVLYALREASAEGRAPVGANDGVGGLSGAWPGLVAIDADVTPSRGRDAARRLSPLAGGTDVDEGETGGALVATLELDAAEREIARGFSIRAARMRRMGDVGTMSLSDAIDACVRAAGVLIVSCEPGADASEVADLAARVCADDVRWVASPVGAGAAALRAAGHGHATTLARGLTAGAGTLAACSVAVLAQANLADVGAMRRLFALAPRGAGIILAGEPDGLRPVGCGTPFLDMLSVGDAPVVALPATSSARLLRDARVAVASGDASRLRPLGSGEDASGGAWSVEPSVDEGADDTREARLASVAATHVRTCESLGVEWRDVLALASTRDAARRLSALVRDEACPEDGDASWVRAGGLEAVVTRGATDSSVGWARVGDRVTCPSADESCPVRVGAAWPGDAGEPAREQGVLGGERGTVVAIVRDPVRPEGAFVAVELDGRDGEQALVGARTPWDLAWAQTVASAQGSSCAHVTLVLERESFGHGRPIEDRALISGALSCARDSALVCARVRDVAEAASWGARPRSTRLAPMIGELSNYS